MANPATIDHLEVRFRPLSDDEAPQVQALLDDAWAIVNAQLPMLASTLASQGAPLVLDVLKAVICNMVIRVLRNPNGVKQWALDDYSETRDSSVSAGALYLSTDEMALITQSLGSRRRGAFSIAPGGDPDVRAEGGENQYPYWFTSGGYYGSTWPDQYEFPGRPWQ